MTPELIPAAQWLAAQHSASLDEFRKKHGEMRLEGLIAHKLAQTKDRRVALTQQGLRELQRARPIVEVE